MHVSCHVSRHVWTSHITYQRVTSHTNESCHIWTSHVTYAVPVRRSGEVQRILPRMPRGWRRTTEPASRHLRGHSGCHEKGNVPFGNHPPQQDLIFILPKYKKLFDSKKASRLLRGRCRFHGKVNLPAGFHYPLNKIWMPFVETHSTKQILKSRRQSFVRAQLLLRKRECYGVATVSRIN